jgi:hypothetical protein
MTQRLNKQEYINELVDELVDVSVDFGENPSEENTLVLGLVSEMLYNAVNNLVPEQ